MKAPSQRAMAVILVERIAIPLSDKQLAAAGIRVKAAEGGRA